MPENKIQFIIEIDEHGQPVIKSVGKDFEDLDKKAEKSGKTFSGVRSAWLAMTAAMAAFGVVRMAREVLDLAEAASDMNETVSKSEQIFKTQEASIEAWANTSAASMGLSKQAALEHTATLGNMFNQLGAGLDISAKTSQSMVQLSADIASFHNVTGGASEVLLGMQSAFRGEYDALQRYIPTINAAAVQQQALAMTHKTSAGELTNLEKALAAVEIIMRDAGAATGDFERTSAGAANQQRIFEANISNLRTEIGANFLPIIADAYMEINKFIKSLSEEDIRLAAEALKYTAEAIVSIGIGLTKYSGIWIQTWQALGLASSGVISYKDALTDASAALERFNRGLSEQAKLFPIGPGTPGYEIYNPPATSALGGAPGTGGEKALKPDLAKEVEDATMAFEAAKSQRTELEIFMESDRISALQSMEQSHRQWEMDQLTASSDYKMAVMQNEHEWSVEALAMRNEEMVSIELDLHNRMVAINQQAAQYKQQIAIGLATALLSSAGASSKAIFAVTQGFQIGLAIMSAHAASALALANPPGPPWTIPIAAAALKLGYLQAAAIAATTIGQLAIGAGGGGGTAVNAPGSTGYQSSVSPAESLGSEADQRRDYAQKWEVHIHGNVIGQEDWVENSLLPDLKKVAKRDTEITVSFA